MFRPLTLFIGLRYAYSKKKDNFGRFVALLSTLGILIGTMGLIIVLSVMNGLEQHMQDRTLHYYPQVQITGPENSIDTEAYPKSIFSSLDGVENIVPLVTTDAVVQSQSDIVITTLMGIEPSEYEPIKTSIFQEQLDTLTPSSYNVIIGFQLAKKLNLFIGDTIRITLPEVSQITPIGRLPSQRLFRVSGIYSVNSDIDNTMMYVNINDLAKLMRLPNNAISGWRLFIKDPLNVDQFETQKLPDTLHYKDWREKKGELFQAIKMEKNIMSVLISLIIIVAAFNIITSLSLLVMEKQNEIAILKTQGLRTSQIMTIFIIQGASSGLLGTIVGGILGMIVTVNLTSIMEMLNMGIIFPTIIDASQVCYLFLFLISLSILSTLYPAYKAAKINPIEALRYE